MHFLYPLVFVFFYDQELHPPFDIQEYGERIINKLTVEESGNVGTFTDLMKDQEKHDVARAFSALLQLVSHRGKQFCLLTKQELNIRIMICAGEQWRR